MLAYEHLRRYSAYRVRARNRLQLLFGTKLPRKLQVEHHHVDDFVQPLFLDGRNLHVISLHILASDGGQEQDYGDHRRLLHDGRRALRQPQLVA